MGSCWVWDFPPLSEFLWRLIKYKNQLTLVRLIGLFLMANTDTLAPKKIRFARQWRPTHHRSGWGYAMDSLDPLHGTEGVLLDGFVEKKFAWDSHLADKCNGLRPYQEPWIGILHNPPNLPRRFNVNHQAPEEILQTQSWHESMHYCRGLFTLSKYLKEWLQPLVPVLVCNLLHPTETPQNRFSARKYLLNRERQLVQIGWWLRRLSSLYSLQLTQLKKTFLNLGDAWIDTVHHGELNFVVGKTKLESVQIISYLSNDEYDELLSKNIVFLDLYASSANNVIVECIARATPILVNPLPAVVEYLGHDYPLYFETLEEAAWKAENEALVLATHEYLKGWAIREKLTRDHFLERFVSSEIYRQLPSPSRNAGDTVALPAVNSVCAECNVSGVAQQLIDDPLVQALQLGWDRALAGDGQERANWRVVEGDEWSWQQNAVCARSNGSDWSAYEYSRCDTQALRVLKNFVIELTISGSAQAAGLSFGPYKDFLAELSPQMDRHRLQLEVDGITDSWSFRIDGRLAEHSQWNSAVRNTADLVAGTLTLKVRGANCVAFHDLAIHTLQKSCELSVIITCYRFAQRLRLSLRNWVHQSLGSGALEILVINPSSPDGTHELLAAVSSSYPHVRVREVPTISALATNKGAMINRALEVSRGQWIWLTDADCLFSPTAAAVTLDKIAGRNQRLFYGERRYLSNAQTNALLSGRLDGLSQFDLLASSAVCNTDPGGPGNGPWGYTQIMDRSTAKAVRYRDDLNYFAHSDSQFAEGCERQGISPEKVEGLFCLHLDHPFSWYGTNMFL